MQEGTQEENSQWQLTLAEPYTFSRFLFCKNELIHPSTTIDVKGGIPPCWDIVFWERCSPFIITPSMTTADWLQVADYKKVFIWLIWFYNQGNSQKKSGRQALTLHELAMIYHLGKLLLSETQMGISPFRNFFLLPISYPRHVFSHRRQTNVVYTYTLFQELL